MGIEKGATMAGTIIRKMGILLVTVLKVLLQIILFLFKFSMTVMKVILILFTLVLRIFLVMIGVSIRD